MKAETIIVRLFLPAPTAGETISTFAVVPLAYARDTAVAGYPDV
ncbi:MAG: hypothetical protein ACR2L2_00325 [Acidobacteriota bacterium]